MTSYTEFYERLQGEFLNSLKATQELNLKTLASMSELVASVPTFKADSISTNAPTPTQVIEHAFAFTSELLATRKEYLVKLSDLATQSQAQFTETAKRVSATSTN